MSEPKFDSRGWAIKNDLLSRVENIELSSGALAWGCSPPPTITITKTYYDELQALAAAKESRLSIEVNKLRAGIYRAINKISLVVPADEAAALIKDLHGTLS